jgi:hypothetical protein
MPKTFASLKKQSGAVALQALVDKTQELNKNSYSSKDDRFWEPTTDKTGSGYATLRFLPAGKGENENSPFIRYFRHNFKGQKTGKWYINNSLTTIGKEDPVGDYNRQLWNTDLEENINFVRQFSKRKIVYVSNILVIDDPAKPENNGKVFLLRYGVKIMAKIQFALGFDEKGDPIPGVADEDKVNVFDLYEGADFNYKIRVVKEYNNYDNSSFAEKSPLLGGDDEAIEAIWSQEYPLFPFIDPSDEKLYPSYETLQKRLVEVLDLESNDGATKEEPTHAELMAKYDVPSVEEDSDEPTEDNSSEEEVDDTTAFFNKLRG